MSENKYIEGEELMQLVREQVACGQVIRYLPFRGRSMLPMLREGKDSGTKAIVSFYAIT